MIPELNQLKANLSSREVELRNLHQEYEDQAGLFERQRLVVEEIKQAEEKLVKDYEDVMTPIETDHKGMFYD